MVDRFLAEPVLKVKETEIKFEYRGVRTKIVCVLGYPCQDSEQALIRELGAYGKVLGVQHESVKDFVLVPSGILRVRMEMNCPVPNLLKADGRFAQCEYEDATSQVTTRTRAPRRAAPGSATPNAMRRAGVAGGDHAVSACRARTYSSMTARLTMAATEGKGSASAAAASTTIDTTGGEAEKPTATPALPGAVEEAAKKGEGVLELVEATLSTPAAPASAAPSEPASSEPASEGGGEGDGEQPFTLVTKKRTRRKRSQNTMRKASPPG
ncbi:hypothetical protein HPB50_015293 [Hyalomma asiaticum]|uniref:Uncharacterized protein n=1 Tax=Hyalomma asiaticum TaxID=266040 RepID=A0ACB7RTW5_HYAAI|nr:hypothetical protein HPB50_015293 [Hyalomma asiaticum]